MKMTTPQSVQMINDLCSNGTYKNKKELANEVGIPASTLTEICNGKRKYLKGALLTKLETKLIGFSRTLADGESLLSQVVPLEMVEQLRSLLGGALEHYISPVTSYRISLEDRLKIKKDKLEAFVEGKIEFDNHQLARVYVLLSAKDESFEESFPSEINSAHFVVNNYTCSLLVIHDLQRFVYGKHDVRELPLTYRAPVPHLDLCICEEDELEFHRKLNLTQLIIGSEQFENPNSRDFTSYRKQDQYRIFLGSIKQPGILAGQENIHSKLAPLFHEVRSDGLSITCRVKKDALSNTDLAALIYTAGDEVNNLEKLKTHLHSNTVELKDWAIDLGESDKNNSITRRFKMQEGEVIEEWLIPVEGILDVYKRF